jgi:hypothetical protein
VLQCKLENHSRWLLELQIRVDVECKLKLSGKSEMKSEPQVIA